MRQEDQMFGNLGDYRRDIVDQDPLYRKIVDSNLSIYRRIENALNSYSLPGFPINVGSTNSSRLSCIIDPRQPEIAYPCDFDIVVVVDSVIDDDQKRNILASCFPSGKEIDAFGRIERRGSINGLPASYTVIDNDDKALDSALKYNSKIDLSAEELDAVRILRLFAMRNGVYGGFTGGFKGISLEQLVKRYGSIDGVLSYLASSEEYVVESPVDGSNLVANLRPGIINRVSRASKRFLDDGKLKLSPYSIGDWMLDHNGAENFEIADDSNRDTYGIFKSMRACLRDSSGKNGRKNLQRDLLLIPYLDLNRVYVSIGGGDREKVSSVKKKFLAKINS